MSDLNLPPLERAAVFTDHSGSFFHPRAYVANSVEARERILLARIAELEADAARYRWLKDHAAYSLYITEDERKICHETAAEKIERDATNPKFNPCDETPSEELEKMASLDSIWSVYVYYHGSTLDAAIDAAREAKP